MSVQERVGLENKLYEPLAIARGAGEDVVHGERQAAAIGTANSKETFELVSARSVEFDQIGGGMEDQRLLEKNVCDVLRIGCGVQLARCPCQPADLAQDFCGSVELILRLGGQSLRNKRR
ncbi:hypothetical protein AB0D10_28790 [Kitasatospora sp. NPDC048545]|uniref:hypothetical protein n=1 Tax=Kitasatospora sp. NPDC048545 TaxID=3157208 RepID=UPI0033E8F61C